MSFSTLPQFSFLIYTNSMPKNSFQIWNQNTTWHPTFSLAVLLQKLTQMFHFFSACMKASETTVQGCAWMSKLEHHSVPGKTNTMHSKMFKKQAKKTFKPPNHNLLQQLPMLIETVIRRGRMNPWALWEWFFISTLCYMVWVSREETVTCMEKISKRAQQGMLLVFAIALGLQIEVWNLPAVYKRTMK